MRRLSFIFIFILALSSFSSAQVSNELLKKINQIQLLAATPEQVKQILFEYQASDDKYHNQTFSSDEIDITVYYSSGTCSDDEEETDAREVWNVAEWKVTRIEIELSEPIKLEDLQLYLSKLKKEIRYSDQEHSFVYHDKAKGIAYFVDEDGVDEIVYFPQKSQSKKLCPGSTIAREFYSKKSWFGKSKPGTRWIVCYMAMVDDLILSSYDLKATDNKKISVKTLATDPENDVLFYVYSVSAGRIQGTGANVVWDLSGVKSGTYTITAGVDDGAGVIGRTFTQSIKIN